MQNKILVRSIILILYLTATIFLCSFSEEQTSNRMIMENRDAVIMAKDADHSNVKRSLFPIFMGSTVIFLDCIIYFLVIRTKRNKRSIMQTFPAEKIGRMLLHKGREPKDIDEINFVESADKFVNADCIRPSKDQYQNRVYLIISTQYKDPDFDVKALCLAMGISKTKCYSDFNLIYRKTPKEIINDYRLTQGLILLKSSDKAIGDISSEIGFKSHSGFTKGFKKKFGYSPSQIVPFYHN